ncbi:putative LRR receptor-like serine/threonine-protein kinase [Ananas comosus]|uniref:Putative LRR receptor-like serine/threonine-protein kinase n=1 Tax=Ananas comosus TaxID=4615 RepID=A0A199V8T7_ANACO|nr:putative LRR receptor-like serine/threonine-protein kinase [Ananas comosus]
MANDLEYIDLSQNQLTGSFPEKLLPISKLTVLDLSSNQFSVLYTTDCLPPPLYKSFTSKTFIDRAIMFSPSHQIDPISGTLSPAVTKLISLTSLDISLTLYRSSSYNTTEPLLSLMRPITTYLNLRMFPDSSFHPGNSRLEFLAAHLVLVHSSEILGTSNSNIHQSCDNSRCIRISRGSGSEKVSDKSAQRKSLPELLVVKVKKLASRKGSTSEMITHLIQKRIGCYRRFSWSPESGETYVHESLGKLDVRSPDKLAGELHFWMKQ